MAKKKPKAKPHSADEDFVYDPLDRLELCQPFASPKPYELPEAFLRLGMKASPILEFRHLWHRFADLSFALERSDFLGTETRYSVLPLEGPRIVLTIDLIAKYPQTTAAANYGYVRERLCELLSQIKLPTTPSPAALRCLIENEMGGPPLDGMDDVASWEQRRRDGVTSLQTSLKWFFASHKAERQPDESRDEKPSKRKRSNYLGITLDDTKKSMKRAGFEMPVLFASKPEQWKITKWLVDAGELGMTAEQRKEKDTHTDLEAWRQQKPAINNSIAPLKLEIEAGSLWRLKEIESGT